MDLHLVAAHLVDSGSVCGTSYRSRASFRAAYSSEQRFMERMASREDSLSGHSSSLHMRPNLTLANGSSRARRQRSELPPLN